MKDTLIFIQENWIWLSPILLEIALRLFPTPKNVSIIDNVWKLLNKIVPNVRLENKQKDEVILTEDNGKPKRKNRVLLNVARHILGLSILLFVSVSVDAQIWQNFKGSRYVNSYSSDTLTLPAVEGSYTYFYDLHAFYGRTAYGWKRILNIADSTSLTIAPWEISSEGNLQPDTDNAYNLGSPSSTAELSGVNGIDMAGIWTVAALFTGDGIQIINNADPLNPYPVGKLLNGEQGAPLDGCTGIIMDGDTVYVVVNGSARIVAIDITNKQSPVYLGSVATTASPWNGIKIGNILFVGTGTSVQAIDVTIPSAMIVISTFTNGTGGANLNNVTNIFADGVNLYCNSFGGDAITVLNKSNPALMTVVSVFTNGTGGALLDGCHMSIKIGNYLFTVNRFSNSFVVLDATNPALMLFVSNLVDGTGGVELEGAESIFLYRNNIWVANFVGNSVQGLDVTNPLSIGILGNLLNGGAVALDAANRIAIIDNVMGVASFDSNAVQYIDVSDSVNIIGISKVVDGQSISGNRVRSGFFNNIDATTGNFINTITSATATVTDLRTSESNSLSINSSFPSLGYPLSITSPGFRQALFQGTDPNDQASIILQNDRAGLLSYTSLIQPGSTSTLGALFGLTRADRTFLFSDGANSGGMAVGTVTADPLSFATTNTVRLNIAAGGNIFVGTTATTPTAYLHFRAGTATASTAPIKFTAGLLNTAPESGALETDASNNLFYTNLAGTRTQINTGGITNTAANNEIPKSNGTNIIPTGIFTTTDGNVLLGNSAGAGAARTIAAQGSAVNISLDLIAKAGRVNVDASGGFVVYNNMGTSDFLASITREGSDNVLDLIEVIHPVTVSGATPIGADMTLTGSNVITSSGTGTTGGVIIKSGDGSINDTNTGNILISNGTPTGTGTRGTISFETGNDATGTLRLNDGANEQQGIAALVGGTITVNNTKVTANTRIRISHETFGGTPGLIAISARVVGTSFTITSLSALDTSIIFWQLWEPN